MRFVLALLMTVLAAGCTHPGVKEIRGMPPERTISVVSLLGDTMGFVHIGTTLYDNKYGSADVAPWAVDDALEQRLARIIEEQGPFRVVASPSPAQKQTLSEYEFAYWTSDVTFKAGTEALREIADSVGAELLLFVVPRKHKEEFFRSTEEINGYGVMQREFFHLHWGMDYASLTTVLVEAATGRTIAAGSSMVGEKKAGEQWIEDIGDYTPEDRVTEASLKELIVIGAREALGTLSIVSPPSEPRRRFWSRSVVY